MSEDVAQAVEIAVVGRGLIGSAAARHLAEQGVRTALIGAGEPVHADWTHGTYPDSTGPFASHYDEGRITRISDRNAVWSEMAARSIDRYRDIANRSGIDFYAPCGLAQASSVTAEAMANAQQRSGDVAPWSADELFDRTGIRLQDDHPGTVFYEGPPAGRINPRRLVQAQTQLAEAAGALVVNSPATAIVPTGDVITIKSTTTISATKVLLATGAYGADLANVDLVLERRLRTILLAELDGGHDLPCMIDSYPSSEVLDGMYWVPPVPFPDGRTMLKIGGNSLPMITADSTSDIGDWFRSGGLRQEADALRRTVEERLPNRTILSWDYKPCVVTNTPTELPYVDFVDTNVAVALGGSGSAAKSSDELGRLAAALVTDTWADNDPDAAAFAALRT